MNHIIERRWTWGLGVCVLLVATICAILAVLSSEENAADAAAVAKIDLSPSAENPIPFENSKVSWNS